MDQQIASQPGADLSPLRAPSVYDFRDRNDGLSGHLSDSVNVRSVYQIYYIGFGGGSAP
jgi:clorobiocin/coumermycin A biosynthesis protein CloN6/CouN6